MIKPVLKVSAWINYRWKMSSVIPLDQENSQFWEGEEQFSKKFGKKKGVAVVRDKKWS